MVQPGRDAASTETEPAHDPEDDRDEACRTTVLRMPVDGPITGKTKTKSTEASTRKDAERFSGKLAGSPRWASRRRRLCAARPRTARIGRVMGDDDAVDHM